MNDAALKTLIRSRAIARRQRENQQLKLTDENDDFHETIRAHLDGLFDTPQFWNFARCGNEEIYRTCKSCRKLEKFTYRCNIKWCPRCQFRITAQRQKVIELWGTKIRAPKHLVLTQKNFPVLTHGKIRQHTARLAKMRRRKIFRGVRGGCISVEITNEGNGWHLHSHWLIDSDWLDIREVAKTWGSLVGQEFAIVKIMDVRNKDYLQEVSKYVVEGSELAKWPAEQAHEFVRAVRGLRFFFSFGTMSSLAPALRRELAALRPPSPVCDCGCGEFFYEDEQQALIYEIKQLARRRR